MSDMMDLAVLVRDTCRARFGVDYSDEDLALLVRMIEAIDRSDPGDDHELVQHILVAWAFDRLDGEGKRAFVEYAEGMNPP